jgi:hypothetical protein
VNGRGRRATARPAPAPNAQSWTNDAWIFASLVGTGRTTLTEQLWRADAINHAVPTAAEIRTSLRHLHARGLVTVRGRTIGLSARGRRLHAAVFRRKGGLFSIVANVDTALATSSLPRRAPVPPALAFVTASAVHRAYVEYAAAASAAFRSLQDRPGI